MALAMPVVRRAFFVRRAAPSSVCASEDAEICAGRCSGLYDNLRGASKKMLTDSLRGLERDGFVERIVYAEVPVRVEYSLTALGWSATELLMALADWADEHLAAVEQARLRYREAAIFGADSAADVPHLEAA